MYCSLKLEAYGPCHWLIRHCIDHVLIGQSKTELVDRFLPLRLVTIR